MRRSQGIAVLVSCPKDGNTRDGSPPLVVAEMLSGCSPACRRRSRCRGGVPVGTNHLSDYRGGTAPSLRLMARSRRQGHQRGDVDRPRVAVAPMRLMPEVGNVSRCPPTVMMV